MQLKQTLSGPSLVSLTLVSALRHFQRSDLSPPGGSFPLLLCIPQTVGWNARHCEFTLLVAGYFCVFYNIELCSEMHLNYLGTVWSFLVLL